MTVDFNEPARTDATQTAVAEESPFAAAPVYARTNTRKSVKRGGLKAWMVAVPLGVLAIGSIGVLMLSDPRDNDSDLMATTSPTVLAEATTPAPSAAPVPAEVARPAPAPAQVERPSQALARATTVRPTRTARAAPIRSAPSADDAAADVNATLPAAPQPYVSATPAPKPFVSAGSPMNPPVAPGPTADAVPQPAPAPEPPL